MRRGIFVRTTASSTPALSRFLLLGALAPSLHCVTCWPRPRPPTRAPGSSWPTQW